MSAEDSMASWHVPKGHGINTRQNSYDMMSTVHKLNMEILFSQEAQHSRPNLKFYHKILQYL